MKTYFVTYGYPLRTGFRFTGQGFINARSFQHAWDAAMKSCGKGEQVLFVDTPPDPYPEDKDPLDYKSIDVV